MILMLRYFNLFSLNVLHNNLLQYYYFWAAEETLFNLLTSVLMNPLTPWLRLAAYNLSTSSSFIKNSSVRIRPTSPLIMFADGSTPISKISQIIFLENTHERMDMILCFNVVLLYYEIKTYLKIHWTFLTHCHNSENVPNASKRSI